MKQLTIQIWILLISISFNIQADQPVIIFADNSYPPYSYEKKGEMKGIYTEILQEAFDQMAGYEINIRPIAWKRGLKFLEQGVGFALYPPYLREKTRPFIKPYSVPILAERVVVVCHEEIFKNGPRPVWPYDYINLTIGRNSGFEPLGIDFWRLVASGKIKEESARGNRENLLKLIKRRIPCYANDRLSIFWELKQMEKEKKYNPAMQGKIIEGVTVSTEWGYVGYTNNSERFSFKINFISQLNKIINTMKKNGRIDEIYKNYTNK